MLQQSLAELCFLTSSAVRGRLVVTGFGAGAGAEPQPPELAAWAGVIVDSKTKADTSNLMSLL